MTVEVDLTQQIISINDTRTEIVVQAPGPSGFSGSSGIGCHHCCRFGHAGDGCGRHEQWLILCSGL
jgi:hypothetical protein